MVYTPKTEGPTTYLKDAYHKLSSTDKERVRYLIMVACDIGDTAFYDRLDAPDLYSKVEKYYISRIFGVTSSELFKSKRQPW